MAARTGRSWRCQQVQRPFLNADWQKAYETVWFVEVTDAGETTPEPFTFSTEAEAERYVAQLREQWAARVPFPALPYRPAGPGADHDPRFPGLRGEDEDF